MRIADVGALLFLLLGTAAPAAWAHGGEVIWRPPPAEKKLKDPGDPPGPITGGGNRPGAAETAGGDARLGPCDWKAWWMTQRASHVERRPEDVETPSSDAGPSERSLSVAALRAAVADADEDVATSALVALGRVGDRASEERLIAVVLDPRAARTVRESAACGLAFLGRAASDPGAARSALERVAMDAQGDGRLRAIATYALGLRGETESSEVLGGLACAARTDPQVAAAAATSLGMVGSPECVSLLRTLLARTEGCVDPVLLRVHAAHGLARAGGGGDLAPLVRAVADPEPAVRRAAFHALGVAAAPSDDAVLRALRRAVDSDRDVSCREAALLALGRQGHADARRILEDAAGGGRSVHREYALTALGLWARRSGDPRAAAPVRTFLAAGTDASLRAAACFAAALARDRDAAPVILRIAETRNDPFLRAVAVSALPSILARDEASAVLERLLAPEEPIEIRREAAAALGALGDASAAPTLGAMLESGDRLYVRAAAAVALGRVGGKDAVPRLRRTLETREREGLLRGLAAVGLGILLGRPQERPLHLVADDLDWNSMTDAAAELASIL